MITVADIMNPNVITVSGLATIATAVQLMNDHQTQTLIVDRRHPNDAYGIITANDISSKIVAYGRNPHKVRVYEIMTKPCLVVNPDLAIEYAARLFANYHHVHSAPVIKERLLGILSINDILAKSNFLNRSQEVLLEEELQEAIQFARTISTQKGHESSECLLAWESVAAIQAEAAHHQGITLEKTAFEEYLEENPRLLNADMMENWCSG